MILIHKALELYKLGQTLPVYPAAITACAQLLDANNTVYMQKVPQDPLVQCPTAGAYSYAPAVDLGSYVLSACLEDKNDPEKGACPGGFTCASSKCYQLTQP